MIILSIISVILFALMFVWGFWVFDYISSLKLLKGFSDLGVYELSGVINTIVIPLIFILITLGLLYLAYFVFKLRKDMLTIVKYQFKGQGLLDNMSKNIENSNNLQYKSAFLNSFDFVLEDLSNDLLDIILEAKLLSSMIIKAEMEKSFDKNFYKVSRLFLSLEENTPNFEQILNRKIQKNEVLSQRISIFQDKYLEVLKKVEEMNDVLLLKSLKSGFLGKINNIFTKSMKIKSQG